MHEAVWSYLRLFGWLVFGYDKRLKEDILESEDR